MFQHHDGAAVREGEGRGRIFIRGLQRREHLRVSRRDQDAVTATGHDHITCTRPHLITAPTQPLDTARETPEKLSDVTGTGRWTELV